MDTLMATVTSSPALLVVLVGMLAMATAAHAKVPRKSTSITTISHTAKYWGVDTGGEADNAIATHYKNKYRQQAAVSGHHQAAKNLRKQGVPLNVARMILFGYE
jgi:hypothetical protein